MVQRVIGHERSLTTLDLYTRRTDNSDRILQALSDPDYEEGEDGAGFLARNQNGLVSFPLAASDQAVCLNWLLGTP